MPTRRETKLWQKITKVSQKTWRKMNEDADVVHVCVTWVSAMTKRTWWTNGEDDSATKSKGFVWMHCKNMGGCHFHHRPHQQMWDGSVLANWSACCHECSNTEWRLTQSCYVSSDICSSKHKWAFRWRAGREKHRDWNNSGGQAEASRQHNGDFVWLWTAGNGTLIHLWTSVMVTYNITSVVS